MPGNLRAYEMVEGTSPDEVSLMKQQRRIEEAQRLRKLKQAARLPPRRDDSAKAIVRSGA